MKLLVLAKNKRKSVRRLLKMGEKKYRTPQKVKVNADNKGYYTEMTEAKEIAEEYAPNKKTK